MDLFTQSNRFYPQYRMLLAYEAHADMAADRGVPERYRLIFITSGNGYLSLGDRIVPFTSPSVLCLRNEEKILEASSEGYEAEILYFHPNVINNKFSYEQLTDTAFPFTGSDSQDLYCLKSFREREHERILPLMLGPQNEQKIRELITKIVEQISTTDHDGWPCLTRSYFIELLFYIQRIYSINPLLPMIENDPEMNDIIVYLNTNYNEKITINTITERFCTNRTSLSEKFYRVTGTTVIDYVNRLRTHFAGLLLRDTKLPVNDIMYRVGFNDPTHFGKVFKTNYGFTPSDYRREFSR